MDELNRNNNKDFVLKRVAKRSFYCALIGLLIGIAWNPPFKGITTTSNDVQGLTYFSCLMTAGIGTVLGAFAGLVGKHHDQQHKETETSTSSS